MLSKKHQSAFESTAAFMVKIEELVREIAIQYNIPYYRIESRLEHYAHMGAEDSYMPVIRIITYFEDTVSKVIDILHSEFEMVQGKSIDKKKNRIDSFSYKRIQYIANLKTNRRELIEYKRLGEKKFELQLCSMLQDAWSGIENELGYDTASHPDESKRDFYRVGALLEMADIEFLKIRSDAAKKHDGHTEYVQQPEAFTEVEKANAPKEIPVAEPVNTFIEHLQSVAKEVPAPVAEVAPEVIAHVAPVVGAPHVVVPPVAAVVPEVIVHVAPVVEQPQVVAAPVTEAVAHVAPVVEAPQVVVPPVAEVVPEVIAYVAPVVETPQVVVAPVAEVVPEVKAHVSPIIEQIVAVTEPVHKAVNPITANSIVPQRAIPETPKPTAVPFGIAPQRFKVPVEEPAKEIETASMNVDSYGTLAVNDAPAESKNYIIDEKIAEIINSSPLVEQPAPQEEPQPVVINEVTPHVAVAPEAFDLVENIIPTIIPEVIIPKVENIQNVNLNGNSNAPKTPEATPQPIAPAPKVVPFFEDQTRSSKVVMDENAPMNEASLREYVISSNLLKEVDMKIAERAGAKINTEIDIEGDVERLRFLKVFTLKQLTDRLTDNKNDIVSFAEKWIGKDNGGSFDSGISLFYLEYLLVGKKNDPAFAIEYVVKFISDNDYSARYIIPTYNSIRSAEVSNNFSHLTIRA